MSNLGWTEYRGALLGGGCAMYAVTRQMVTRLSESDQKHRTQKVTTITILLEQLMRWQASGSTASIGNEAAKG